MGGRDWFVDRCVHVCVDREGWALRFKAIHSLFTLTQTNVRTYIICVCLQPGLRGRGGNDPLPQGTFAYLLSLYMYGGNACNACDS